MFDWVWKPKPKKVAVSLEQPLRYLIGASSVSPHPGTITEVGYDLDYPGDIAYCNLFDEKNTGKYGPYLHDSDTAQEYNEGQIDPAGQGWRLNLQEQFERRKKQGFKYVELDNPDAYSVLAVVGACKLAESYGFSVIAKNPLIMAGDVTPYVARCPAVVVEAAAGMPWEMERLRQQVGKSQMPVWFVFFGGHRTLAGACALQARSYTNMWVSYSADGEYGSYEAVA